MRFPAACSCGRHHDKSRREFLRVLGLGALALMSERIAFGDAGVAATPGSTGPKYYGAFIELPVGAVKPQGWIAKWLERQAEGLTGHPENLAYPYDTCMYAGVIPSPTGAVGDVWWPYEQSGYFIDGTTRLSHLVDALGVEARRKANIDYILAHSTDEGYGASKYAWPNAVVGRALLAEWSATGNEEIPKVIENYLLTHAKTGNRDGVNAEEALKLYAVSGNPALLDYAKRCYEDYLHNSFAAIENLDDAAPFYEHGVTAAELLKILPAYYLYTGDQRALELARTGYDKVTAQSVMPDGGMISNEELDTPNFVSLHETCDISDWSWSMGYQFMATGDVKWADLIERTIFNALPGAVTKDFKQLQYFSCANQILATSLSSHGRYAQSRMSYRAAHDTQCCTGNVNRAMPNYVIRQWMRTPDGGLAAVYYGPSEVTTQVKEVPVTVTQTTDYPFRDKISFQIKTPQPIDFALHLRIPAWCGAAKVTVNGTPLTDPIERGTFLAVLRQFKDGDTVELTLPMEVRMEHWFNAKSIVFTRGPLVFTFPVQERRVELMRDTKQVQPLLQGNNIQGFPALEFYPQGEWRYGIDYSTTFKNPNDVAKVVESPMTDNPFIAAQAPVKLEIPLRHMPKWQPTWTAESNPDNNGNIDPKRTPQTLPTHEETLAADPVTTQSLVPYGATHLRLTTLPVIIP